MVFEPALPCEFFKIPLGVAFCFWYGRTPNIGQVYPRPAAIRKLTVLA